MFQPRRKQTPGTTGARRACGRSCSALGLLLPRPADMQSGARLSFIRTDVSVEADVKATIAYAVDRFGRLDYLVNNAGSGSPMVSSTEATAERFDGVFAVNGPWSLRRIWLLPGRSVLRHARFSHAVDQALPAGKICRVVAHHVCRKARDGESLVDRRSGLNLRLGFIQAPEVRQSGS
jgi:NAD(P)-dependent dehydrogenase (short-subunit alcohol dehydrogenase family)